MSFGDHAGEPPFALRLGVGLVQLSEPTQCRERCACRQRRSPRGGPQGHSLHKRDPETVPPSLTAPSSVLY